MSKIFNYILLVLFLISIITSVAYVTKIVKVVRWHKSDPETYRKEAMPAVRVSKIWNTVLGVSLAACAFVFLTHAGRVCAGWYLPSHSYQSIRKSSDENQIMERNTYLLSRGAWFVVAACFGVGNIVSLAFFGFSSVN